MIQRLPTNDNLRPHSKDILAHMFKLLELENEENVLVCLRIIIELHKQFRPPHSPEIGHFLQFVKSIYRELPNRLGKIFQPRPSGPAVRVKDLSEVNLEALLSETFTTIAISVTPDKKTTAVAAGATPGSGVAADLSGGDQQQPHVIGGTAAAVAGQQQPSTYNLIPRATLSLKVLQELPIIVVLMYQLYKQYVHNEVAEFIPLIMSTITLQPSPEQRAHKDFNREIFVDFMGAQIKTLSFLAYIIRIYQEVSSLNFVLFNQNKSRLCTLCGISY